MQIDEDRVRGILAAEHSYYGGGGIPIRHDDRWSLGWMTDLITRQLSPDMRVLDVGCGNGHILMEMSDSFRSALGIDTDPEFLQMAEEAKLAEGIRNVDFRLLEYPRDVGQLQPESFDMVISIRGPLTDSSEGVEAAHHLLRPDGLLFCQEIAELHRQEEESIFGHESRSGQMIPRVTEVRVLMEQNGFGVRLAADLVSKSFYRDVYAWLRDACNIWTWLGVPLPEPDDPRIAEFAERNTIATGEIKTTDHVCWVAGVKE